MAKRHKSSFQSILRKHPRHVKAIGMIAVEVNNLEIMLGTFLAAFLNVEETVGHIIYMTPKTSFGRLAIIENLVTHLLEKKRPSTENLVAILDKAKTILGKRHRIIHGFWGVTDGVVSIFETPVMDDDVPTPYTPEKLEQIVADIRGVMARLSIETLMLKSYHLETSDRIAWSEALQSNESRDSQHNPEQSSLEKTPPPPPVKRG